MPEKMGLHSRMEHSPEIYRTFSSPRYFSLGEQDYLSRSNSRVNRISTSFPTTPIW